SAQLAAGYNQFTNYSGAFWAQKKQILGLLCDLVDFSRSDASTYADSNGNMMIGAYESWARARWPTNSNTSVDYYIAQMSDRESELQAEDVLIHAAAQQTNHTFSLTLVALPTLNVSDVGNQMILSWTNAGYVLQSTPNIGGPFTTIPGATS